MAKPFKGMMKSATGCIDVYTGRDFLDDDDEDDSQWAGFLERLNALLDEKLGDIELILQTEYQANETRLQLSWDEVG